jgi:hypothetical protein
MLFINLCRSLRLYTLNGGLSLGESYFTAALNFDNDEQKLTATWEALEGATLGFNDLANALNLPMFAIPTGLDLALKSAGFTYDFKTKTLTLQASSENYGQALYLSQNVASEGEEAQWEYVCIFQFNTAGLTIGSLPLLGQLPENQQISLEVLQISGASYVIDATHMSQWIDLIPPPVSEDDQPFILPPSIDYPGVAVTARTPLGSMTLELFLPLSTGEPPEENEQALMILGADDTNTTPMNTLTVWLRVQNTLQINDAATTSARTQVYDVLTALGIAGLANDSLAKMAADPGKDFVDEPWLSAS